MNYNFTDLKTDHAKWMTKYGKQQQNRAANNTTNNSSRRGRKVEK